MQYDELVQKEKESVENGQRNRLTLQELENWAGSDDGSTYSFMCELVLDIANGIYSIEDFLKDIEDSDV